MCRKAAVGVLVVSCFVATIGPAFAATPTPGWTKVILRSADDLVGSVPADLPQRAGGRKIWDYASYKLVAVPTPALKGLRTAAEALGINVEIKDEFDILEPPGGSIDTRRESGPPLPSRQRITPYVSGTQGLFLIQFIGPPIPEWIAELGVHGVRPLRYIPHNGMIIGAPAQNLTAIRNLSFVQ